MSHEQHYSDYKWIKVKRWTHDDSIGTEENYQKLQDHHLKETSFLIEEVRKLAKKLDEIS